MQPEQFDLDETDAITLTNVVANDDAIVVNAGGDITALNVVSTTDSEANDISLTTTSGAILVTTIDAGALGDVFLDAAGAISDDQQAATVIGGCAYCRCSWCDCSGYHCG